MPRSDFKEEPYKWYIINLIHGMFVNMYLIRPQWIHTGEKPYISVYIHTKDYIPDNRTSNYRQSLYKCLV